VRNGVHGWVRAWEIFFSVVLEEVELVELDLTASRCAMTAGKAEAEW